MSTTGMRILLIAHESRPIHGWGRYTKDLARALKEEGHDVEILSEWLGKNNLRTLHDPDAYLGYSLAWLRDRTLIRRALTALKPDVVHVTVEPYLSAVPRSYFSNGKKLFLTIHGTYAYYPKLMPGLSRVWGAWCYARTLAAVQTVIAVSQHTKQVYEQTLIEQGVPLPRTSVIVSGVRVKDAVVEDPPSGVPVVLSVGAVKARKGILEILKGVALLHRRGVPVEYYVVGSLDTSERFVETLRAYAREQGIEGALILCGALSDDELRDAYRRATALALLPRAVGNSLEGFGLVYLEANAYGVPVLGARGTVSEEAIREGESGLLCNPDSPDDIADRLAELFAGRVSRVSARRWAEEHDWSAVGAQYLRVYATP